MLETKPDPLPVGYHFDRYVIEFELPLGILGRVYKAFDTQLKDTVALNVPSPALRATDGKWRLVAGLKRALQQKPPQAYDYGEWEGIPYVTVPYIDGVGAATDVGQE
jgi:serine/threonine protein kinase